MIDLQNYVTTEMKMSAIYQPVIISALLDNGGSCSLEHLGKVLSIELHGNTNKANYYVGKLKLHPNKVLTKNGVATVVPKSGEFIFLKGVKIKDPKAIMKLCASKIKDYLEKKNT